MKMSLQLRVSLNCRNDWPINIYALQSYYGVASFYLRATLAPITLLAKIFENSFGFDFFLLSSNAKPEANSTFHRSPAVSFLLEKVISSL